ncbi:MAG TPA: hypothetical protein VMB25_08450 [Bryobacteraceae bacterium]|nr:hypothetical protein [Bryobacteraceae bacterium]
MEWEIGAFLQRRQQKRLGVADEADFAGCQTELLPNQTHQPVRIGAAGRIAVAAGSQDQPNLLWGSCLSRYRARQLIGERLDDQRMSGIGVIVMNRKCGMLPARLTDRVSERFALEQVEIEGGRKNEDLTGAAAADRGGQIIDGSQLNVRSEAEYRFAGRCYRACVAAMRVANEDERRGQCSLPPMRPCLTMVASTSTMARTATSAVMSEIS